MTKPILLLTRPEQSARRFAAQLSELARARTRLLMSPLMRIEPLSPRYDLGPYAGVVFTSANGVVNAPPGEGRPAYCVGPYTAEVANGRGWRAQMCGLEANEMVARLGAEPVAGPLAHLAGAHRRGEVAQRLSALGMHTDVIETYDQRLLNLSDEAQSSLGGTELVLVPLFSPRSAAHFAAQTEDRDNISVIALSKPVAEALDGRFQQGLGIADEPTGASMVEAVEKRITRATLA
ncbi:uroporphyrinogen-III synthase [Sulfitobacter aestuarii]|uniref:Uroporphyrinogen-III synthase n=1 Tax=Sulfitobacter aestuarii TaxID=2161676 RepID=A0ABW5U8D2_9RHOB